MSYNIMIIENIMIYWNFMVFISFQLTRVCPNRIPTSYISSKTSSIYLSPTSPNDISCHKIKCWDVSCEKVLPMIDKQFWPPKKTVYFIETSCIGGLQSRAACSVESAAYSNPNWHIVVLFAGPLKTEFWKSMTFFKLRSIPNLYFYRLYPTEFAKGTPIQKIFLENVLSESPYSVVHSSDMLKVLLLYKYGGLYLDLDMIVMKSFDSLPNNFIARERKDDIASGIIAVTKYGVGHKLTEISMRDFANSYNPTAWVGSRNSHYARSLQKICATNKTSEMSEKNCQGFHVLDHELFYPIDWEDWYMYYRPGIELPTAGGEYTHHFWNSYGWQVDLQPNTIFTRLAEKYCPLVYNLYKDKFGQ